MESLDFAYDLTDKLIGLKIDHILITLQRGEKVDKSDIIINLSGPESEVLMIQLLYFLIKELSKKKKRKKK